MNRRYNILDDVDTIDAAFGWFGVWFFVLVGGFIAFSMLQKLFSPPG